jgi:hypothetical protein
MDDEQWWRPDRLRYGARLEERGRIWTPFAASADAIHRVDTPALQVSPGSATSAGVRD